MIPSRVAKRYAKALFESAKESNIIDIVKTDLSAFTNILIESSDLRVFLSEPHIPIERKKEVITEIFSRIHKEISPDVKQGRELTLNFISFVIDKSREEIITFINDEFNKLVNEHYGIVSATVTTAVELTADEEAKLKEKLKEDLKKSMGKEINEIYIEKKIEPKIIGGIKVCIGDKLYDSTIATALENTRKRLQRLNYGMS